jgi:hypothetical protein
MVAMKGSSSSWFSSNRTSEIRFCGAAVARRYRPAGGFVLEDVEDADLGRDRLNFEHVGFPL